jgi:hypothetical protein
MYADEVEAETDRKMAVSGKHWRQVDAIRPYFRRGTHAVLRCLRRVGEILCADSRPFSRKGRLHL